LLGAGDVLNEETGLVAPNITPDLTSGAGEWSDAQFERAIRRGIGHDGRRLSTAMPWNYYSVLTDADLASIIRYLRSLPPVRSTLPDPPKVAAETLDMPPVKPLSDESLENAAARGAYLVRLARCVNCHTPLGDDGQSDFARAFSGGRRFELREFWYAEVTPDPALAIAGAPDRVGGAIVASANLTPDASGIAHYSADVLKRTLRTGRVNGVRPLSSAMPWIAFEHMTDADIEAIFSYLTSLEPIAHRVSNLEPPSYCPICRRWHGLGSSNAGLERSNPRPVPGGH
jgi:mono/diheme cytochrome c family protein